MSLFNLTVSKAEKSSLSLENTAFWAKSAVLVKGEEAFLYVSVQNELSKVKTADKKFCLGVLRKNTCPNASLDLKFDSEKVTFSVEGDGSVEVVGLKQKFEYDGESDEEVSMDLDEEETDEECPALEDTAPPTKKQRIEEKAPKKTDESAKDKDLADRKKAIEDKRKSEVDAKKKAAGEARKKEEAQKAAALQAAVEKQKKEEAEVKRKAEEKDKELAKKKKEIEGKKKAEEAKSGAGVPIKKQLPGGLKIEISKQGSGARATPGRKVKVSYDGRLASNGKRFDKGTIEFKLGTGQVIRGWDEGVKGMTVGEKRKLFIPPALGYGARGSPPAIPRNAALIFDVELLRC